MSDVPAEMHPTTLAPEQIDALNAFEAGAYLNPPTYYGPAWALQHLDKLVAYHREMEPLLADLHAAALPIRNVAELRRKPYREREPFRRALPILLRHFSGAEDRDVRWSIALALKNPHARPEAAAPLLAAWQATDPARRLAHLDYSIYGDALRKVSHDGVFDLIARLARDPRYGRDRNNLVRSLRFLRHPRVADLLIQLLDDPDLTWSAAMVLIMREERCAAPPFARLLSDPRPDIRDLAAYWLPRMAAWPASPRVGPDPLAPR